MGNKSQILIYQTEDGLTKIETWLEDETVWLIQFIARHEPNRFYNRLNTSQIMSQINIVTGARNSYI